MPAHSGLKSVNSNAADYLGYGLAGLGAWIVIAGVLWLLTSSRFEVTCNRITLLEPPLDPAQLDSRSFPLFGG